MKKKIFLPTIKKVDLPEDVISEVKLLAEKRILEHGIGTDFKYYILIEADSKLEILQYDLKGVPEENINKLITELEKVAEEK